MTLMFDVIAVKIQKIFRLVHWYVELFYRLFEKCCRQWYEMDVNIGLKMFIGLKALISKPALVDIMVKLCV